MYTTVSMNLTDEELEIVGYLRSTMQLDANTDAVGEALRLTHMIFQQLELGHEIAVLDPASGATLSLLEVTTRKPPLLN
ncbi:hypothetical protein E4L96_20365 [Massilia arenosa]|uniref:Uncharacterized protein n=1 Tax=Zemynaea arenosa TaxID=2561931 RepID=A0A4Y9RVQ7_9BURK|nr:hypothetical protein [Massilia arenosa]TFW13230.1 hypothetical protein E4L96_20365 [Massilia arenosa]